VFLFAATAEMRHNVITGNAQDGIQIDQMSTATIVNNTLRANAEFGLLVSRASTADPIRGNTIVTNGLSGVAVQSDSLATILENHLAANGAVTGPGASYMAFRCPQAPRQRSGAATSLTMAAAMVVGPALWSQIRRRQRHHRQPSATE
jgi:hypothetical protein